ncbi:MAG: hypothetical protein DWQ05_14460 [Calditrichaeota bacterium]|nr:MAG: hypothetical protein DWQ05_14460 [Calditrichota bacterium]
MLENVIANNGFSTALSGMLIVFSGLVLIALAIYFFNLISQTTKKIEQNGEKHNEAEESGPALAFMGDEKIPEDELVAISVAIELYSRLHFEPLQSELTFLHGELTNSGWKTGIKYGQRQSIQR